MNKQKKSFFSSWKNKQSALITGASSGIGAVFAQELAKEGFKIVLTARRKDRLEELAKKIEKETKAITEIIIADLANEKDRQKIVTRINGNNDIEILINNAGFGVRGRFYLNNIEKYQEMMLVHNTAPVEFCRAVLPSMIKRSRGIIINVSSMASLLKNPRAGIYSGSKSFLNVFSDALSSELKEFGIKVQSLCPGMTVSEFHSVRDYVDWDHTRIPKRLWMSSEEVVEESLIALYGKKIIVIPGRKNKRYLWLWNRPFLRKLILWMLGRKNI